MTEGDKQKYLKHLEEFQEVTHKFYNKEIPVQEYKSFSGKYGSYAQRGGERSMLRLRMSGGEVTKEHLQFIVDSIAKHQISMIHLTTCQTVQLHNLTEDDVCQLVMDAFHHGIYTAGGGGDFPRNVMCSPLTGVEQDGNFDVMPYVRPAAEFLLGLIDTVKLPRKLKVCFSSNPKNEPHATFRDLGFVSMPDHTFDVYAAGGLGPRHKMGAKVAEGVDPKNILYCIQAMVDVFTEHGNYTSRATSRSRYLQDTLGAEGFRNAFQEKLTANLAKGGLDITIAPEAYPQPLSQAGEIPASPRVIPQKQAGYYAVSYHPIGGKVQGSVLTALNQAMSQIPYARIRLVPEEGMYIINLTASEAAQILELTQDGAVTQFEHSTACIGADVCQVGIGTSQTLLQSCIQRVRQEHFADGVLPNIHISGCPSSCAAHQTALLGFRGGKKPTADGPKFAYSVFDYGCDCQGQEQFGTDCGSILETEIPEFLVELGNLVAGEQTTYADYRKTHPEEVKALIKKYTDQ